MRYGLVLAAFFGLVHFAVGAPPRVADGFTIETIATAPVIERPVMACFDERGRLFVVDSSGSNDRFDDLVKNPPHRLVILEDTDGNGVYDKRTLFADKLAMPQGVLPLASGVLVASPPSVWRLRDTDGDGVCDERTEIVTEFGSNGNAADIHGPFLGPDGWIWLCDGRHGHKVKLADGRIDQGLAGGIFRFRPDGSGFERLCGGGFDNPVEIDFTDEGEVLGTVNILHGNPRKDCLMHWVDGGAYPRHDQEQCLAELKRTGDLLPEIKSLGHVAVAGMTRYRSTGLGPQFQNGLFVTLFNQHKLLHSRLTRNGATFSSTETEILTSDDQDFHPTDVLEDADGSLLVINTGGWFRLGCPVSVTAKPDILGAIYRIRPTQGVNKSPSDGTGLSDPRVVVRIARGDRLAESAVGQAKLIQLVRNADAPVNERQTALWALARKGDDSCRMAVLASLSNPNPSLKQTAARASGLLGIDDVIPALVLLVKGEAPAELKRDAATALGRLCAADRDNSADRRDMVVAALFEATRAGFVDRYHEHAVLYALIQIGAAEATRPHLSDALPRVRRAALIALDQMEEGNLTRELVTPLLDTDDLELRNTVVAIIGSRQGWASELSSSIAKWLGDKDVTADRLQLLRGVLLAQSAAPEIQKLVATTLSDQSTGEPLRLLLWEVIGRSGVEPVPAEWNQAIARGLRSAPPGERQQVLAVLHGRTLPEFDEQLVQLAGDESLPFETRLEAASLASPRLEKLDSALFQLFVKGLHSEAPLVKLEAARGLAAAPLSREQLRQVIESLPRAGSLVLPSLAKALVKNPDAETGAQLVATLKQEHLAEGLSGDELAAMIGAFPESVQQQAAPLLASRPGDEANRKARLAELSPLLSGGDVLLGRDIFHGKKAACASCHAVAGAGARVGPDLSKIAGSRGGIDLLEAVVFPSATFAREYRPVTIATTAGKLHSGLITRQTADAVFLRTAELAEIRVARDSIEDLREASVSIMPQGLDRTLSPEEFRNLLAYLMSLK